MLPEQDPRENAPQSQVVSWLDEERRRDKGELQRMQSMVDQVLSRYRETIGRLELAETELRGLRAQVGRVGHSEDGLREVRELLVAMRDWQEEHQRVATRSTQTEALAFERDKRTTAEIQALLASLVHESEVLKGRLTLVGEEMRRDKGNLPPILSQIEDLGKRLQGLLGRLDLVVEADRHRDLRLVDLAQQLERVTGEQSRFTDWQRLSEVRWSRQILDWQSQMEEWRRQSEDSMREVQGVAKSVPALKDEMGELRRVIGEERERGTERATAIAALVAQRGVDREALGESEKRLAVLTGRVENFVAQFNMVIERLDRAADGQQVLEGRMRAERERVESILIHLARLEERDALLDGRLEDLTKAVAAQGRAQTSRTEEAERNLGDLGRRLDLRLRELERLEEEQKQREIAELEQQIREMQERAKQAKG